MSPLPLADHQLVALPRAVLVALRAALLRDAVPDSAAYLQEAGYAGGDALFASFERWLGDRGEEGAAPDALPVGRFEQLAGEYFRDAGWGSVTVGTLGDAVVTLDSEDWWEDEAGGAAAPESFVTIGLFARFFSRLAGEPLAVLQVESRAGGGPRARFLLGNAEVLDYVYDRVGAGGSYEEAVASVA